MRAALFFRGVVGVAGAETGVAVVGVVVTTAGAAAVATSLFSLALLPIIIFESGYSLNLDAFFSQVRHCRSHGDTFRGLVPTDSRFVLPHSRLFPAPRVHVHVSLWCVQLGSVLMFALAGTVTATLITGGLLWKAGQNGFVSEFSFDESMSFASLISATDPVATLSVFSALNVEAKLYSIVYGESVLNDAVAIVLFRTFTAFITEEVTGGSWGVAVGNFFFILIGSSIIGVIFGIFVTLVFKYVHLANEESNGVQETAVLLLFAYGSYVFGA